MDKLSYSLGLNVGYSYLASGINKLNVEDFAEGVRCVLEAKEPAISIDEAKQSLTSSSRNCKPRQRRPPRPT
jgi:FKBP-type peptidyl-prolyl cis-trans isomerase FklB